MTTAIAFVVGVVFAAGLALSGMTIPAKVIGFLDFTGAWDPTLLFVMAGATTTFFVFFRVIRGHAPLVASTFHLPTRDTIDRRLVVGAALFGIGWGLAGFCPGPALVSLASGATKAVAFVGFMVIGMGAFQLYNRSRSATQ